MEKEAMKRSIRQQVSDVLKFGVALGVYCVVMYLLHAGCPIQRLTGISCPGCGMTRAYVACLQLDFALAFHYHPLFWLPPIGVLWYVLKYKMPRRVYEAGIVVAIFLFVIVYAYRITRPSAFLIVNPKQGIIGRIVLGAKAMLF